MSNLIESVKGLITNEMISKASGFLGESEGGIQKAISGILPSVFSGFLNKTTASKEGESHLFNMAKEASHSGILGNLGNLFSGSSSLESAIPLVKGLFGDKLNSIISLISSFAGIKQSSASSLMNMIAPLTLGFLGKQASEKNIQAQGFTSMLSNQKQNILNTIPSGFNLSHALGLGSLHDLGTNIFHTSNTTTQSQHSSQKGGGNKWLLPLLLLVACALLAWLFLRKGCSNTEATTGDTTATHTSMVDTMANKINEAVSSVKGKIDSLTGNFIYEVGDETVIVLPNTNDTLKVGSESSEARLVKMLQNADWKVDTVDKTKDWVTLDRLYFETNKSQLVAQSENQVKNIAAILKAFPTAKLKLGGYTDNTGDAKVNQKVSTERAEVVLKKLVSLGVTKDRLASEGYGPEHPVCPANDTPECKAQNRRVDVRLTTK